MENVLKYMTSKLDQAPFDPLPTLTEWKEIISYIEGLETDIIERDMMIKSLEQKHILNFQNNKGDKRDKSN